MKIDWNWLAVASFLTMLLVYFTRDSEKFEKISVLIIAGASCIAFVIGEVVKICHIKKVSRQMKIDK